MNDQVTPITSLSHGIETASTADDITIISTADSIEAASTADDIVTASIADDIATASKAREDDHRKRVLDRYLEDDSVDRMIFVQYKDREHTMLYMYHKKPNDSGGHYWDLQFVCRAYVGENGLGKKAEGDKKTPCGVYPITEGFGIYDNPGLEGLNYTRLNQYLYWSGEQDTYNTMVDVRDLGVRSVEGEHLIKYAPEYDYVLVIGYNTDCVYQKGSGIFLHVIGNHHYTAGCVSVSREDMIRIMKDTTDKTKICIYKN